MAGRMSKIFHLVRFSSQMNRTGIMVITAITPIISLNNGSEFIDAPGSAG